MKLRALDHLRISIYWFGANLIWGALLGPVLSRHIEQLAPEAKAQVLGLLYSVGAIPALLVPLIAGPLSDRCTHRWGRRRPFLFWGGLGTLIGIGILFYGFNQSSLPLYLAGYLVIQIGSNAALATYSGVIPDLVPYEQRGVASGWMAVMTQIGTLIGAYFAGQLLKPGQENSLLLFIAGGFALTWVGGLIGIKERKLETPPPPMNWRALPGELFAPLKWPDFRWVWITRALMMLGFYAVQPFLLYYLRDIPKVPKPDEQAGIVFGLILLAATISGFLGGKLSDRTGRKPIVIWSSYVIGIAALAFTFLNSLPLVLIVGTIFGLGYGAYISVDWALGADVLPKGEDAAKDMAVWHVSMVLPQQISPLIGSQILAAAAAGHIMVDGQKTITYSQTGYGVLFAYAALCFIVGGYLVKNVKNAS